MMEMRMESNLPIPAVHVVTCAPKGRHLMLSDLKQPLSVGGHFELSLHFAKAGLVTVMAIVKPLNDAEQQ